MACHAATRRQDTGSSMHTVNIFRAGFKAHQYHRLAASRHFLGTIGIQHNLAACSAR